MIRTELLTIVAYIWVIFGAYWIVIARRARTVAPSYSTFRSIVLALGVGILLYLHRVISQPALIGLILLWALIGIYWDKREEKSESGEHGAYRILRLGILASTFSLLFWDRAAIGFLGKAFLPPLNAVAIAGFAGALLGLAIAVWARFHLGTYWSDKVVLQENHQLIRTGPYAHLRHPIYSGVLLGVLGTALIVNQWRGVLAFALLFTNYAVKAKKEERIIAERFSNEFQLHRKGTGFLLPRVRSPR